MFDAKYWHGFYEAHLTAEYKKCVDDCFTAVTNTIKENGLDYSGDDRAEKLISAITEYLIESMD